MKTAIEREVNTTPAPTYPQNTIVRSSFLTYPAGTSYGYEVVTTMNLNGSSDFPARVYVEYRSPLGTTQTQSVRVDNTTELAQTQDERIREARSQIDIAINNDRYAPNATISMTSLTRYGDDPG
jgi:hypothetical protein